jgi:hypothetical protein
MRHVWLNDYHLHPFATSWLSSFAPQSRRFHGLQLANLRGLFFQPRGIMDKFGNVT